MDRWADQRTERQTGGRTDGWMEKQTDGWTDKQLDWPSDGQTDRRAKTDRRQIWTGPTD